MEQDVVYYADADPLMLVGSRCNDALDERNFPIRQTVEHHGP